MAAEGAAFGAKFRVLAAGGAAVMLAVLLAVGCTAPGPGPSSSAGVSAASGAAGSEGGTVNAGEAAGALKAVAFSESGNSLGNLYRVETAEGPDGELIVIERNSPTHSDPTTVKEYQAPSDLLQRIAAIADEAGMAGWGDLPMGELFPLDAATPTLTLEYAVEDPDALPEWVSFTAWDELPAGGDEAFAAVRDELLSCLTEENLIREYEEVRP